MAQLKNFSKIIHNGNEIGKVLHQGKTIWAKGTGVYLAKDGDFVKVGGYWVYRGSALEVEIPTHINGQLVTSTQHMFSGAPDYQATPVTKIVLNHSNVTDMSNMFARSQATTLDLSIFNTSNVTNMMNMFNSSKATTLDLSGFDTSNVTNMTFMFEASNARTLDLSSFNTSKVTSVSYMFNWSSATIGYARTQADANKFNSSSNKPSGLNFVAPYLAQDSDFVNVSGNWVYRGDSTWVEIPTHINGELVTSTKSMFNGAASYQATPVTKVDLKHSNVTNMSMMFNGSKATSLDLSSFNTSNVTNMSYMFTAVYDVTTLDLSSFDTSNVTVMSYMFRYCRTTTGYARTQADADKFNASSNKPTTLNFVVKP